MRKRRFGRKSIYGEPMQQLHALVPMSMFDDLETLVLENPKRSRNDVVRAALAEYLNWTPKAETQE